MNYILIPTNNGKKHLEALLPQLRGQRNRVVIIDTGSTDKDSIKYFNDLDDASYIKMQTPFHGHATGALLWFYWTRQLNPADNILLLQDSIKINYKDFMKVFLDLMPTRGAVCWTKFSGMNWDHPDQQTTIETMYGLSEGADGIFGPIFMTNKKTLDYMNKKCLLPMPPNNKVMAMGSERAWAICFKRAGLHVEAATKQWDEGKMESDEGLFRKVFVLRP
jgi:hypothetical protein